MVYDLFKVLPNFWHPWDLTILWALTILLFPYIVDLLYTFTNGYK